MDSSSTGRVKGEKGTSRNYPKSMTYVRESCQRYALLIIVKTNTPRMTADNK